MANAKKTLYTVSDLPSGRGPTKGIELVLDTVADFTVYTPDFSFSSVYVKGVLSSESNANSPIWKQKSPALTGTVSTTNGSAVVTGSGTTFTTSYAVGDEIVVTDGDTLTVLTIDSATQITASSNASTTVSGKAHAKQQRIVTPELAANQGIWDKVYADAWIFATSAGYSLVVKPSAAVSSLLIHVQEGRSS